MICQISTLQKIGWCITATSRAILNSRSLHSFLVALPGLDIHFPFEVHRQTDCDDYGAAPIFSYLFFLKFITKKETHALLLHSNANSEFELLLWVEDHI
jgi:hypothetical protein